MTTKQNSGATPVNVATSVAYEPFGSVSGLTFGNSLGLTLTYDQDYQLTGIGTASGTTTIQSLTNGFDPFGNITSITDAVTSGRSQTVTYDDLNRIHTASGIYGAQTYAYDGVGNRQSLAVAATTSYAYSPSANQISGITNSATPPATGSGTYLFNAFNQRVQKTAGSTATQFIYDEAGHLFEEANGSGTVQKEYIWLDDLPVAMVDDTGSSPVLYFIHSDQIGTPQKITDSSMNIVWDGVFDPFGNPVSSSLALTNLRFPGQYFDNEAALNQNWNRDYDPTTGRYIQSDPIGVFMGTGTYVYVLNNPIKGFDPFGLWQLTFSGGDGFGGSISFGHNSGQWNISGHFGAGEGASFRFVPSDLGCRQKGVTTGFQAEREWHLGGRGGGVGFSTEGNKLKVSGSYNLPFGSVGVETGGPPNRPGQPSVNQTNVDYGIGGGSSAFFGWGGTVTW